LCPMHASETTPPSLGDVLATPTAALASQTLTPQPPTLLEILVCVSVRHYPVVRFEGKHRRHREQFEYFNVNFMEACTEPVQIPMHMISSSHSARRAVHFWPIFSLREHQRAFLGSNSKKAGKTSTKTYIYIYIYRVPLMVMW
jgi:hypothetical protein